MNKKIEDVKSWADTILLPKTDFAMRANLPDAEPEVLKYWQKLDLYNENIRISSGREKFTLHDGPPYANGNLHIGHALNKVLKVFFNHVLKNGINVSHIIVGSDFKFGYKRSGNIEILKYLSKENNIGFDVIEKQANSLSKTYSSSSIREYLLQGNIAEVNKMLGHYWYTMGVVITGANKGNQIGYPTINIRLDGSIKFAHGIYATNVYIDSKRYQGATYYGKRPTYEGTEEFLETYIFDFNSNIYDHEVKIEFIDFVRYDQTYESDNKLKNQMKIDCENVLIKLQYYDKKFSLLDK